MKTFLFVFTVFKRFFFIFFPFFSSFFFVLFLFWYLCFSISLFDDKEYFVFQKMLEKFLMIWFFNSRLYFSEILPNKGKMFEFQKNWNVYWWWNCLNNFWLFSFVSILFLVPVWLFSSWSMRTCFTVRSKQNQRKPLESSFGRF